MLRLRMVVLIAFAAPLACSPGSRQADTAADQAAIRQVREREIAAFSGGKVDSLLAVFMENAQLMPPGEPTVTGRQALRSWAQGIADQFTVSGRYTGSEIVVVGEWAFERYTGALTLTPKRGGAPIEDRIKGVHIYHRQGDGSWLIAHDVWNSDPPQASTQAVQQR